MSTPLVRRYIRILGFRMIFRFTAPTDRNNDLARARTLRHSASFNSKLRTGWALAASSSRPTAASFIGVLAGADSRVCIGMYSVFFANIVRAEGRKRLSPSPSLFFPPKTTIQFSFSSLLSLSSFFPSAPFSSVVLPACCTRLPYRDSTAAFFFLFLLSFKILYFPAHLCFTYFFCLPRNYFSALKI